ncbi:MAG: hypothetical protein ACLSUT_02005 [Christensenellales bacterium]
MKCVNCGKEINVDEARHCSTCGSDYCPECARLIGFCSCYGDIVPYN